MPTVLFVCTANICRSPAAEVLFADWLRKNRPGETWTVASAGTWAQAGQAASTFSRQVLAERGLDLAAHRSRAVDAELLARADVALCMTASQREALHIEFPEHAARVHLLSALAGPPYDVPDPYGGPREGYVEMVAELQGLIERAAPRIVALASQAA
jgi:protein-tyrosine phosphatase